MPDLSEGRRVSLYEVHSERLHELKAAQTKGTVRGERNRYLLDHQQ